ncbi:unnamed protein product, partial [Rotaria sp. Silwood2]
KKIVFSLLLNYRKTHSYFSAIGDRILTAPQTFGPIVTIPDGDIAMIQLDHILTVNGSMIRNGSLNDHTGHSVYFETK